MIGATIVGLPILGALACVLVVYAGAVMQAATGVGVGILSSPVLLLVDPDFIPAAVVVSVLPLSFSVAIADRLGHTSVRTVLDVYGHLYEGTDKAAAERLNEQIKNRSRQTRATGTVRGLER